MTVCNMSIEFGAKAGLIAPDETTFAWIEGRPFAPATEQWEAALEAMGPDADAIIERGVAEVLADQIEAGIDIPTDGEVPRENYIHYHCRHLKGFDFQNLTNVQPIRRRKLVMRSNLSGVHIVCAAKTVKRFASFHAMRRT